MKTTPSHGPARRTRIGKTATLLATVAALSVSGASTTMAQSGLQIARDSGDESVLTQFLDDIGASERINYSGKLRMLSQRIVVAACMEHANIDYEANAALLHASVAEFDQIIDGLRDGDEALGMIGAETDRRVLADIVAVHEVWDPMHAGIEHIIETGGTDEEVLDLATQATPLLEIAKHLVSVLTAEYADPTALLQADALTIDIAGRQRMLAQRISKDVCLIQSGLHVEEATAELSAAMQMYDASANALANGWADAGIVPPPTEEIAQGMQQVLSDWADVQPLLAAATAGAMSEDDRRVVFAQMNSLTGQMNTLVGIYTEESKLNL